MKDTRLDEIWKSVKGELEIVANPSYFKAYIPGCYIKRIDEEDRVIEVTTSSEFQRNFIEERLYGHIKDVCAKIIGPEFRLMFTVTKKEPTQISVDDLGPLFKQDQNASEENAFSKAREYGINSQYSFSRFIVGNSNRLAYAVSTAIADAPGKIYNPFFLYSSVGLGKTHLIQAIGNEILKKHPDKVIIYKTGEEFLNEVIDAIQRGKGNSTKRTALKKKYRNVDVLIIDDVHSIAGKDATQEEFFHTFNTLYMNHKQIILTSDRAPHEIRTLEERLSSRFASGMIADIQKPDYETRLAILRSKNEELKLNAPDDAMEYIASAVESNIRELEAKLLQTVTTAKSQGKDLNKELASSIIGKIEKQKQSRITHSSIIREIAKYYGVTIKDIKGNRRLKTFVLPRQVCMYFIREMTASGFQVIGEFLGDRDHSTIVHGVEKIINLIKSDLDFTKEIDQIKNNILSSE